MGIKVEGLSKMYRLRGGSDGNPDSSNELWALRDVSFEIEKGQSVGIIGPNGSGKSTLLKILAGVTKPTSGKVTITGRVASILDIGAGFHPELSGRENVFLNGQIQGFSKKEIREKFDEIVAFSGIGKFIDEPVKNYSNGMFLRLAFSIMAHLDFDVYLFDEVFTVGDAQFGLKTREKFRELIASDKTIFFVSHNMAELQNQDVYMLLEKGVLKEKTKKRNLLSDYLEQVIVEDKEKEIHTRAVVLNDFSAYPGSAEIRLLGLRFYQEGEADDEFRTDCPFFLELEYEKTRDGYSVDVTLNISNIQGNILLSTSDAFFGRANTQTAAGRYRSVCRIYGDIFNGAVYSVGILFWKNTGLAMQKITGDSIGSTDVQNDDTMELLLNLEEVVRFKPVIRIGDRKVDFGDSFNTQSGLLPSFEWRSDVLSKDLP